MVRGHLVVHTPEVLGKVDVVDVREGRRQRRRFGGELQVERVLEPLLLGVEEEERLVPEDRPADARANDVVAALRLLPAVLLREVVGGVELVVLAVVIPAATELIRPALGDRVDDDAGGAAVFGPVVVRHHVVLGEGVDGHRDLRERPSAIVLVVDAIHEEQIALALAAIRAVRGALEIPGVQLRRNTWDHLHQRQHLAPLRGQVLDVLGRQAAAEGGLSDLDERGFPGHRDLIGERPDGQRQVERDGLPDKDPDP